MIKDGNNSTCKICGEQSCNIIEAKNRRLNDGRKFKYIACNKCDTLQLAEEIEDMSEFYDTGYRAHSTDSKIKESKIELIHMLFMKMIIRNHAFWKIGILRKKLPGYMVLCGTGVDVNYRILDVGCGNGRWLYSLSRCGYKNLVGCDLFSTGGYPGYTFHKGDISSINDTKYDLITFHHSFEHMNNPLEVLTKAKSLMNEDGMIIIRIPVWKSKAWDIYGTNWFQLDPPIHYFLYTEKSLSFICEKVGLTVTKVIYDSTPSQFYISEQLEKTSSSYNEVCDRMIKKDLKKYEILTKEVNDSHRGDQAIFYIKKSN